MTVGQLWTALLTLTRKEASRVLRIWPQTLVPPVVTTSLYFVIFGSLIGSRIGSMGGRQYMDFIVPGLVMMAVITNSYANVSSSFFSAKFQRNVEEMLVSPMPSAIILLGYVLGGVLRGLAVGVVVAIVALLFSNVTVVNWPLSIVMMLGTSVLFSLAGFFNALFARTFDDISIIPTFVLTPLTYLGGVFFSITLLPDFWQSIARINPILYMIDGFRLGVLGTSDIDVRLSIVVVLTFITVMFVADLVLLKRGYRLRS
ncbi:MAG TPA: ABC transporter permease [Gammaproteobacteria bacterium]|nr:ABC transporter permease [Gammaproteobacteria bacterium]